MGDTDILPAMYRQLDVRSLASYHHSAGTNPNLRNTKSKRTNKKKSKESCAIFTLKLDAEHSGFSESDGKMRHAW